MKFVYSLLFIIIFICGCQKQNVENIVDIDKHVYISYPITNINVVDNELSTFVNRTYNSFKKNYKNYKHPELNISYTYKELNNSIINISLNTEIKAGEKINKIKTFTYDKKKHKFLVMEDIVKDLDILGYEIKKAVLDKYEETSIDFLNNINLNNFSFDDDNLTIYFNIKEIKKENKVTYIDIPLNSLKLLIDIDKTNAPDPYLNLKKRNINYDDKVVALTFDDGPSKHTDKIVDLLKKNNAVATFFVVGNRVDFYDEVLIKMLENGNEIGNHSYSHKLLTNLTEAEFKEEIDKTQKEVKKSTGYIPKIFRPTYGGYTKKLREYTDLTFILWDVDSRDWKVKNKDKIYNNIIQNVKNGSIVLMHDNHIYSYLALEKVINKLKEDGYSFVTISELLEISKMKEEND